MKLGLPDHTHHFITIAANLVKETKKKDKAPRKSCVYFYFSFSRIHTHMSLPLASVIPYSNRNTLYPLTLQIFGNVCSQHAKCASRSVKQEKGSMEFNENILTRRATKYTRKRLITHKRKPSRIHYVHKSPQSR